MTDTGPVLVTGAAQGMGREVAHMFATEGRRVIGLDVDGALLGELEASLTASGHEFTGLVADITDGTALREALSDIGPIHTLVNNAAISPKAEGRRFDFLDMPESVWGRVLDVNIGGMFRVTQAVVPAMIEQGSGVIINMTSITRQSWTVATSVAYTSSKAAVDGFTRALAMEMAPHGIRVNAIAPGRVSTRLNTSVSAMRPPVRGIPAGRIGEPSEIADALRFLASDQARYIVGETLTIDGGWSITVNPG